MPNPIRRRQYCTPMPLVEQVVLMRSEWKTGAGEATMETYEQSERWSIRLPTADCRIVVREVRSRVSDAVFSRKSASALLSFV